MFRRTCVNCRMKTRVTIFGLSVLVVSSMLMYRALTSHISRKQPGHGPLSTFEHQSIRRQQAEHKKDHMPRATNSTHTFQAKMADNQQASKDLLSASLREQEYEKLEETDLLSADIRQALKRFFMKLYPTDWAQAPETDEVALDLKYLLMDCGLDSNLTCKQIDSMRLSGSHPSSQQLDYVYDVAEGAGVGTSFGYGSSSGGRTQSDKSVYLVKSSPSDHDTKVACMKQVYDSALCTAMGSYRLLREVLLLTALKHPNIVLMKGYCLRGNRISTRLQDKGLILLTELGTPLSLSAISSSTWSQKVSMAIQVGQLLQYLASSPIGSLRFTKLSLRDFVLVQGTTIKLSYLDNLELGDKPCMQDSHCGTWDRGQGIYCKDAYCKDLNHMLNVDVAAKEVLQPMLHDSTGEALVTKLTNANISVSQFVAELRLMFNKSKHEKPWRVPVGPPLGLDNKEVIKYHNNVQSVIHLPGSQMEEVISHFVRYERKNFAGIYDYLCAGSRVSWGCVHTVSSLGEAATLCLHDNLCQAFVTFSTQPESDNLMTVVLKNATDFSPHTSSGTTLFVRQPPISVQGGGSRRDRHEEGRTKHEEGRAKHEEGRAKHVEGREISASKQTDEIHSCLDRTYQSQEMARYSREKRLMAHLGLKGTREQAWRRSALKQKMEGQSDLLKVDEGGGMFVVNLTGRHDGEDNAAKSVVFLSEDGPRVYHLAYAVIYHLDRILGLYHTPPCVGKLLSAETVDRYQKSSQWDELFRSLIESDGTLTGLMLVPMPRVIKTISLTLEPASVKISELVPMTRSEKLQLEYILLWWLGRMNYSSHIHQGYKDHLIHFYADKAFGDLDLDMSAYLHYCQFPSLVYKSLSCFWCDSRQEKTTTGAASSGSVCSLGEEAVRRTRNMFADDAELFLHHLREADLVAAINSAATSILQIINSCIKTFGSDSVLY